jgi:hypothetical protein
MMLLAIPAKCSAYAITTAATKAATSTDTAVSVRLRIYAMTYLKMRSDLAIRLGLVVIQSNNPKPVGSLLSFTSAVSSKNFIS